MSFTRQAQKRLRLASEETFIKYFYNEPDPVFTAHFALPYKLLWDHPGLELWATFSLFDELLMMGYSASF